MSSGTLYTVPGSDYRAFKALIAAQYSGFNLKVADDFVFGETNKEPAFLKKFPPGKVPALETEGNYIFESNAIAHYVGNEQLRGKDIKEQSQILQWINFAESEILPPGSAWLFPVLGLMPQNDKATKQAKKSLNCALNVLNDHLLVKTYLVGERITQADITVSCILLNLFRYVFEKSLCTTYSAVNRWFRTLINQPQFKAVIGEVTFCKMIGEQNGCQGDKAPEEPSETEQLDETELILASEPQSKDPFEAFPRGSFKMDEFKRVYSNESEDVSLKYFWEKFDHANYSIWYCEYLFPQELSLTFMSCNLIGGMFQRLDKMRKNAFGSVCLFGEDNNSTISGVWFWRGPELAFKLSEDWQIDYESYSWKKLDFNDPETKKLVNEYFSWSGEFGGKKFNQGKIFK